MYRLSFRDANSPVRPLRRGGERNSSTVSKPVVLRGSIAVAPLPHRSEVLEAVGIVRRHPDEPVHREGHIGQEAHEIAILILTGRDHTLGQDPGHDRYQLGLGVELLCAETEGRYGEIHPHRHQEEGGGGEVLATQVFQATVIGVAAEVEPGMEGGGVEPFYSHENIGLSYICGIRKWPGQWRTTKLDG